MSVVLVVDDDADIREAVVEAIEEAGYEVRAAENGRQALDRMREAVPSIVLLDLMMPIMDGWQVVEAMQSDPALATIPVCVVSAADRALPTGVASVLRKPVALDALLDVVGHYCTKRQSLG